jgi:hypothetical protein
VEHSFFKRTWHEINLEYFDKNKYGSLGLIRTFSGGKKAMMIDETHQMLILKVEQPFQRA